MCDHLEKSTEARLDILLDVAFNHSNDEESDKKVSELMNSIAGKLAVYNRELNKDSVSQEVLGTLASLQKFYSMF